MLTPDRHVNHLHHVVRNLVLMLVGCSLSWAGCGAPGSPSHPGVQNQSDENALPLAYTSGKDIYWDNMQPVFIEAAGGQVLAEVILENQIDRRLARDDITVTPQAIAAEREIIMSNLNNDPVQAQNLLTQMRQRRGWGPIRFASLLKRNAALRLLVQSQIRITATALQQAYNLMYGPRYQARLIIASDLRQATRIVDQARRPSTTFVDLAIKHSIDISSAQGGLLPLVSPYDSTFPQAMRDMLQRLSPGMVGDPVPLDRGYAILKLEQKIDSQDVRFDDVKEELTRLVRRRAENILMQKLARQMLLEADVTVFEPALAKSWQRHIQSMLNPK